MSIIEAKLSAPVDISEDAERKWIIDNYGDLPTKILPLTNYTMSIIEALDCYRKGKLITLDTGKLQHVLLLLDGKIDDMQKVIKAQ